MATKINGAKNLTDIEVASTPVEALNAELRTLIASNRERLAGAMNAELTRLC